jgi:predicted enzyme related to lactoylglutathione lyase
LLIKLKALFPQGFFYADGCILPVNYKNQTNKTELPFFAFSLHSLYKLFAMEFTNAINWFEIPVTDFDRAKKFYETIFDYQIPETATGSKKMGFFLYDFKSGKIGGAICYGDGYTPSQQGSIVYLNAEPDLQIMLGRVEKAGGKIIQQKTQVTAEAGNIAFFIDTEGNRVALHSRG